MEDVSCCAVVVEGGRGRRYTLRGEVAEWLNAAVSKTVMSVIPASGVRIPPSPLISSVPDFPFRLRPLCPSHVLARCFDPRRGANESPATVPDGSAPVE